MQHWVREVIRYTTAASLVYSGFMIARCPCDVLPACKFGRFVVTAVVPVTALVAWNVHALMRDQRMFLMLKKTMRP